VGGGEKKKNGQTRNSWQVILFTAPKQRKKKTERARHHPARESRPDSDPNKLQVPEFHLPTEEEWGGERNQGKYHKKERHQDRRERIVEKRRKCKPVFAEKTGEGQRMGNARKKMDREKKVENFLGGRHRPKTLRRC